MSRSTLPAIQAQRYDREDLGAVTVGLTHSAAKGPTYLRVGGRIAFVVVAVELFDALWPDSCRAYATAEMPEHLWNRILQGIARQRLDEARGRTGRLTLVQDDPD